VRGTTRRDDRAQAIEASGAEAALADPDRLATLLPHIEDVAVVCWLMGSAAGQAELVTAINGPRLETMLETLVDTPVRGVVYEAAGRVDRARLERGAAIMQRAGEIYRMRVEVVEADPAGHRAWLEAMMAAVRRVLS
jgi:hypothetical protein